MNLSQLRKIIKEELLNSLKENTTTTKPGTKEKEETGTKPKRRSLVPDKDKAPNPRPKAMMKENEKQMVDKIAKRFKGLSK
jgi:hypothetical protein